MVAQHFALLGIGIDLRPEKLCLWDKIQECRHQRSWSCQADLSDDRDNFLGWELRLGYAAPFPTQPTEPDMDPSSRNRLTDRHLERFPGDTLFEKIARAVCHAGCLPRKELHEAWEVARRVRRRFRGGRVVDLACGHGLLASILLLLDDTSPTALAIDPALPASAAKLKAVIQTEWPRLVGRVELLGGEMGEQKLGPEDLLVSVHACGRLTDQVIDLALAAHARVAVLPCCHDLQDCDDGALKGWLDGPLAIDVTRAARLRAAGYRVITQTIPVGITPKNRLLLAEPGR